MTISIWEAMLLILHKDLRSEIRNRCGLNILLMFGITSLIIVSFSLGTPSLSPRLASALLWVIIYFVSVVGLSQIFSGEQEGKTMDLLLMAAPVESIYFGKMSFSFLLLIVTELVVVSLFFFLFNIHVVNWLLLIITLIMGSLGLAGSNTLVAALISGTKNQGPLLAVLAFPILFPLLIGTINTTLEAFGQGRGSLGFIMLYPIIISAIALLLIDYVWEE